MVSDVRMCGVKLVLALCVVMAAAGYPGTPRKGDLISGIEEAESQGATVFHAGTKAAPEGVVTSGGRVLGVTASGDDLLAAIERSYAAVCKIGFAGMQYRCDIGQKGLKRWPDYLTAVPLKNV